MPITSSGRPEMNFARVRLAASRRVSFASPSAKSGTFMLELRSMATTTATPFAATLTRPPTVCGRAIATAMPAIVSESRSVGTHASRAAHPRPVPAKGASVGQASLGRRGPLPEPRQGDQDQERQPGRLGPSHRECAPRHASGKKRVHSRGATSTIEDRRSSIQADRSGAPTPGPPGRMRDARAFHGLRPRFGRGDDGGRVRLLLLQVGAPAGPEGRGRARGAGGPGQRAGLEPAVANPGRDLRRSPPWGWGSSRNGGMPRSWSTRASAISSPISTN